METDIQSTDGSVLIRPHRPDDVYPLYEAVLESMAELSVWMRWCHADYSIDESRMWIASCADYWAKGTEYNFTIADTKNGSFLGSCGLNQIIQEDRCANLGYWVRSGRTGEGIATTAALLVARFGFDKLRLNRIQIIAVTDNKASLRVAEKLGATREGTLRNRFIILNEVHDAVMYSLIPRDLDQGIAP